MKTINRLLPLTLAVLVLAAGFTSAAEARSLRMEVNGLVCAFCADGITKAFKKEPAAGDVFVSLEDRLVAVDLKEGQDISDAAVTKLLTDAGYKVVGIQRSDATVAEIKAELGRE
ncbi:MAG: heavy-metal-associated domain-containing protein [Pseudoxanthomonas sp.]|nr:heavy-metal-associated domain-containing protein [Pseudoxanthomonas sp.]